MVTGIAYYVTSIIAQLVLAVLASVIVMWFSRLREFRADAGGARLAGTGKMVGALERLKAGAEPLLLSMRGTSYIEGPRPVRSGLRPPPSRLPNLDREETRPGFLPSFRGFAGVRCNTRRPGGAERAACHRYPVATADPR